MGTYVAAENFFLGNPYTIAASSMTTATGARREHRILGSTWFFELSRYDSAGYSNRHVDYLGIAIDQVHSFNHAS